MKNTAADYKSLYEKSLKTITEKDSQLTAERELLAQAKEALTKKDQRIQELNFELDRFRKYLFGKKSEKLTPRLADVHQLSLFDLGIAQEDQEALSEQAIDQSKKQTPKKRAKGTGRMMLPENLRREVVIIEPEEDTSGCKFVKEEITEVLQLVPAEFYVIQYKRRIYALPNGAGILAGQLPDRVVEKGIPSERLVAQMTIDKYVYGLPLHRQIDKYRRMGVNIPASTASDWLIKGWKHLVPLWELLRLLVTSQKYLQVDESPIKVQDRNHKNGIRQGYMWVYNCPVDNLVLFDYRQGRDSSGPMAMLRQFKGIIQTDGFGVYESLYANHPDIILIYCMAHARRKFVDARGYDQERADFVLKKMQKLYELEQEMREAGFKWKERTAKRQEVAQPTLDEIEEWLKNEALTALPGSPLGKAIAYTLPRWKGLSAYVNHGQLEIDNNLVENAIRPLAIGRKNYLFAGSQQAAEMTAAMYSFMAMCKKNGINEVEWMTDVFERIQSHKHKDLYQLLPNNWLKYKNPP
jgi:transposase